MKRMTALIALMAFCLLGAAAAQAAPVRVLILSGSNNHDWKSTTPALVEVFKASPAFTLTTVLEDPTKFDPALLANVDVIVSNWNDYKDVPQPGRAWGPASEKAFLDFLNAGGGFVVIHAASAALHDWPEFQQLVGVTWGPGQTAHGAYHTFKVEFTAEHPITKGLVPFWITDELYHNMIDMSPAPFETLARSWSNTDMGGRGAYEPMLLTTQLGQGRGVNIPLGHDVHAIHNPGFQVLLKRASEWAATGSVAQPLPDLAKGEWPFQSALAETVDREFEPALAGAARWKHGEERINLFIVEMFIDRAQALNQGQAEIAARLAAAIEGEGSIEGRQWLLRQLSRIAGEPQVELLARLMTQQDFAFEARYALERVSGEKAGAALRQAIGTVVASEKPGVLNTLGQRRDAQAEALIIPLLKDADDQVAIAAATALGKLGGEASRKALGEALAAAGQGPLQRAVFDGLMVLNERTGQAEGATVLAAIPADSLTGRDEAARQRALLATAPPAEAGQRIWENFMENPVPEAQQMALRVIRELPEGANLAGVIDNLPSMPAAYRAQAMMALADRGEQAALPAARQALADEDEAVRVAALAVVARLGSAEDVPALTQRWAAAKGEEQRAVRETLAAIPRPGFDAALQQAATQAADAKSKAMLFGALADRASDESVPFLLAQAGQGEPAARTAAWQALQEVAPRDQLPALLEALGKAGEGERAAAERAVAAVARRRGQGEKSVGELIARIDAPGTDPAIAASLLRVLGQVGGAPALERERQALADSRPELRDAAIRALADWQTTEAAPELVALSQGQLEPVHRALVMQSLARQIGEMKDKPVEERVKMIEDALTRAERPEDKQALLQQLGNLPTPAALKLATAQLADPAVIEEAALAVNKIAEPLAAGNPNEVLAAVQQVIGKSKNAESVKKADEILRKVAPSAPAAPAQAAQAAPAMKHLTGEPQYAFEQTTDSLALLNQGQPVWKWQWGKDCVKPFAYPVALPDGTQLTWPTPADHPWHRSLWFSWKEINGLNYWEEEPGKGAAGITEVIGGSGHKQDKFAADVILEIAYHPPNQPAVMTENRHLEISPPAADGSYYMDWQSTFRAVSDVTLKGGTVGGGYAGMSARISQNANDFRLIDSEGRVDVAGGDTAKNTHGQHARWNDFSLTDKVTGQRAGIAIMDHPQNLRFPSYWHNVIIEGAAPFGYFSPATLWAEPYTLKAGEDLVLRYRIYVHPGQGDLAQLDKVWEDWTRTTVDQVTATVPADQPPQFSWLEQEGKFGLMNHGKLVWQSNHGKDLPKPSFHPVSLLDGMILTEQSPQDHDWHKALWFSLNGVTADGKTETYWWEDAHTHETKGQSEVLEVATEKGADHSAVLRMKLAYHPIDTPAVLTESREVRITPPTAEGYQMDWTIDLAAADKDVTLEKGYGGLCARISQGTSNWRMEDSEGRTDVPTKDVAPNSNGQPSRWVTFRMQERFSDKTAAMTILDHPSNFNHPSLWHNVMYPNQPFGFFNPAITWGGPHTMKAGEHRVLRYRVLVNAGQPDKAALEAAWQAFSKE